MEINLGSKKAFSLIEIAATMVIFIVILLAIFSIMLNQFKFASMFKVEYALKEDATYTIEKIKRTVMNSEHVDIVSGGTSIKLFNRAGTQTGTLTLSANTLTYTPTSGTAEIISNKINSLVFDNAKTSGNFNTVRLLKIDLRIKDSAHMNVQGPHIITTITCRLTPFLKVVCNVSRNPKLYYDVIQDAINDVRARPNDEIRCMGKVPGVFPTGKFFESIQISNSSPGLQGSVKLRGSYDSDFDATSYTPVQNINITANNKTPTPTTIDGNGQTSGAINCSGSGIVVTINGFVIKNGRPNLEGGSGIYVSYASDSSNIAIYNNILTGNIAICDGSSSMGGGIYAHLENSSTISMANNIITLNKCGGTAYNLMGAGILLDAYNSCNVIITNNIVTQNELLDTPNMHTGAGITACVHGALGAPSTLSITNNIVTYNTSTCSGGDNIGSGMRIDTVEYSTANVSNNFVSENTSIKGGECLCQHSRLFQY